MLNALKEELGFGKTLGRETPMSKHIPYRRHITDSVVNLSNGNLCLVIKMDGLFFQTVDQSNLNMRHGILNNMMRSLGSSRFTLWSTIIRREVFPTVEGTYDEDFNSILNDRYMKQLHDKRTFVNELYLTVVLSPLSGALGIGETLSKVNRMIGGRKEIMAHTIKKAKELEEIGYNLEKELGQYGAKTLGIKRCKDGNPYSELCSFFDCIVNLGSPRDMRLPKMDIAKYIGRDRLHFSKRSIQSQGSVEDDNRFGALLSIKEYPTFTGPGILNDLLTVNHEFILTQSFAISDKPIAQERITRLQRQISNSDEAGTQVETDINGALGAMMNQEVVFGFHHFSLMPVVRDYKSLDRAISEMGAVLNDMNINWLREDLNMEALFWAQLPGNKGYIARDGMVSSSNFVGFASNHNFAVGQKHNLHWGTPICVLETTSQTPYYFNFHDRDIGHFLVTGPTGSGKTVVMTFLLSQAFRVNPKPKAVFFDKDRGAEIFIRAIGGSYEALDPNKEAGFNFLQIENNQANREFILRLLQTMLRKKIDDRFTQSEEKILSNAITTIMNEPESDRSLYQFRTLLQGQSKANDDDLYSRLTPWVEGDKAWLFNAERDVLTLSDHRCFGFDMTSILDNEDVRTPALMYLFHRLDELLTGDPVMMFMDEGWKLLSDPAFSAFIVDKLKTIRKLNGIVGFGTQSAGDIVKSPASHTLIEQAAVNIHFPNSKADTESYIEKFNLSVKEYNFVKKTAPESRRFLIKRGLESVVASVDLSTMPDLLKVLSGRKETVDEMTSLIEKHGNDPAVWLPIFCGWEAEDETAY